MKQRFFERLVCSLLLVCFVSACSFGSSSEEAPTPWYNQSRFRGLFGDFEPVDKLDVVNYQQADKLLERGAYLANAVSACGACHAKDPSDPSSPLTGGQQFQDRFGLVYASNITSDVETGIGAWDVSEIVRLLRAGIDRDGKPRSLDLHATYRWMSDEDAKAVAMYVLSLPASKSEVEKRELGAFQRRKWGLVSQHRDIEGYVPAPSAKSKKNWGKYLSQHVAGCYSCHTPEAGLVSDAAPFSGAEKSDRSLFGAVSALFTHVSEIGGDEKSVKTEHAVEALLSAEGKKEIFGDKVNDGLFDEEVIFAKKAEYEAATLPVSGPDIRGSSAAGLLEWSEADIVKYLSSGLSPEGRKSDARVCPWPFYQSMSESDKQAIASYLKSL